MKWKIRKEIAPTGHCFLVMVENQGFISRARRNYERSSAGGGIRHLNLWFYVGGGAGMFVGYA